MIEIAVAAKTRTEHKTLSQALARLAAVAADFSVGVDHENGRIAIKGDSEPYLEAITSAEYLGDIVTDLKGRRGDIIAIAEGGGGRVITAVVRLADMLGYARTIGLLSRGHARFVMRFSHYAQIPPPDDAPFRPAVGMRA